MSENAHPPFESPQGSPRGVWIFLTILMLVGATIGALVFMRASDGSAYVLQIKRQFATHGATLDAEQCVTSSLTWYDTACTAPGQMCLDAVPMLVGECLGAQDRTAACTRLGNTMKSSQWAYQHCMASGIDKHSRRPLKEACTQAWRALDTYCKSGQTGVAL